MRKAKFLLYFLCYIYYCDKKTNYSRKGLTRIHYLYLWTFPGHVSSEDKRIFLSLWRGNRTNGWSVMLMAYKEIYFAIYFCDFLLGWEFDCKFVLVRIIEKFPLRIKPLFENDCPQLKRGKGFIIVICVKRVFLFFSVCRKESIEGPFV